MPQELLIGVQTKDLPTLSVGGVEGATINIGGMLIRSERGPISAVRVKETLTFQKKFGKELSKFYGHSQVRGFFENLQGEPGELYIRRVVANDAVVASATFNNIATTPAPAWKIWAGQKGQKDPGSWGKQIHVAIGGTGRASSTSTAAVLTGETKIKVNNVAAFKPYDFVSIGTVTPHKSKILRIDETENELHLETAFTAGFASGVTVSVLDRTVFVYFKEETTGVVTLVESWNNTTLDENSEFSWDKMINDPILGSDYIFVELLATPSAGTADDLAVAGAGDFASAIQLTGGADGATPVNADYASALKDFDVEANIYVTNAEVFSEAIADDGEAYCAQNGKKFWIGAAPLSIQGDEEALLLWADKRKKSRMVYAAFYKDWYYVDDPNGNGLNPVKVVPPVGALMGHYIYVTALRGIHKVPAGKNQTLAGIRGIYKEEKNIRKITNYGNAGLNPTSLINGTFCVRDSQTPSKLAQYKFLNATLMSIYFKVTFERAFENLENEPNSVALLERMRSELRDFSLAFYVGSSNGGQESGFASFIKPGGSASSFNDVVRIITDESINPQEKMLRGELYINYYFMAPAPARSIEIGVGLMYKR